ncbi:MAG: hypothetical protein OT477_07060 [Chloroflexi bacterium]|nr:hypothetical protein [Chloroflexota bacterium]
MSRIRLRRSVPISPAKTCTAAHFCYTRIRLPPEVVRTSPDAPATYFFAYLPSRLPAQQI